MGKSIIIFVLSDSLCVGVYACHCLCINKQGSSIHVYTDVSAHVYLRKCDEPVYERNFNTWNNHNKYNHYLDRDVIQSRSYTGGNMIGYTCI